MARRNCARSAHRFDGIEALAGTLTSSTVCRYLRTYAGLWERLKNEPTTPREIGWAIAVGVFAGCTPFVGLHMLIAIAIATVFRLHRLWAFAGSRISFAPLFAAITFCEIEGAHRLRRGSWLPLSRDDAVRHGADLMADWILGAALLGSVLAAVLGFAAYVGARVWQTSARRRSNRNKPAR